MDEAGDWSLAPAYDLTYVVEGELGETYWHQMTINGKVDGFRRADLLTCAASAGVARARAAEVTTEVQNAVVNWRFIAEDCAVPAPRIDLVERRIRDVNTNLD